MTKSDLPTMDYNYAFSDLATEEVMEFLTEIPSRWGRMPPLSRALVVEAGRALIDSGVLARGQKFQDIGKMAGLIGATSQGSLTTDLDFAATLQAGANLASPALFGYTLPNIPLSEAASQYGMTGPVYAIFTEQSPISAAIAEAERWLANPNELALMLACAFDSRPVPNHPPSLSLTFTVVSR